MTTFNPNVDIIDSILRNLRQELDVVTLRRLLNREEQKFYSLTEEFRFLKESGQEGAPAEMAENIIYQLINVLELFGVQHEFDFLVNLDPNSPQFRPLLDSGWHVCHLLWSASKQSSDDTFCDVYDQVPKTVDEYQLFSLIQACLLKYD